MEESRGRSIHGHTGCLLAAGGDDHAIFPAGRAVQHERQGPVHGIPLFRDSFAAPLVVCRVFRGLAHVEQPGLVGLQRNVREMREGFPAPPGLYCVFEHVIDRKRPVRLKWRQRPFSEGHSRAGRCTVRIRDDDQGVIPRAVVIQRGIGAGRGGGEPVARVGEEIEVGLVQAEIVLGGVKKLYKQDFVGVDP